MKLHLGFPNFTLFTTWCGDRADRTVLRTGDGSVRKNRGFRFSFDRCPRPVCFALSTRAEIRHPRHWRSIRDCRAQPFPLAAFSSSGTGNWMCGFLSLGNRSISAASPQQPSAATAAASPLRTRLAEFACGATVRRAAVYTVLSQQATISTTITRTFLLLRRVLFLLTLLLLLLLLPPCHLTSPSALSRALKLSLARTLAGFPLWAPAYLSVCGHPLPGRMPGVRPRIHRSRSLNATYLRALRCCSFAVVSPSFPRTPPTGRILQKERSTHEKSTARHSLAVAIGLREPAVLCS